MNVIDELVIPATEGRACLVGAGQVLRIAQVHGRQVADATFLNADDHREGFHVGQSIALNMFSGIGTMTRYAHLYSRPPFENPMLTVVDDPVGEHFAWNGGRCSPRTYELRRDANRLSAGEHQRSCQQNLEEALAAFGVPPHAIPDVFNIWMRNDDAASVREGRLVFLPPTAGKDDYIDLRAEMNVLAAISACPSRSVVNDGEPKPLRVQILST